jgi:hypothetical protein
MPKGQVFISYSHRDKAFVMKLDKKLKELKFPTWRDVDQFRGGDYWENSIDEALRGASTLVVVMSRSGRRSQYVAYEWAFALGAGIRVIPLPKEQVPFHPRLGAIQFVDFTKPGKTWLRLIDALRIVPRSSTLQREPGIQAEFEIKESKPKRIGREYVILIWMTDCPRSTREVTYEIRDPSFPEPKWSRRNRDEQFSTRMSSYGDVLLTAR